MDIQVLFRQLNQEAVVEFRKWSRDNYELGSEISELWHPVVQEECELMNIENNQ